MMRSFAGRVSKWLKDADCKSARFVRSSVRIRPLPPFYPPHYAKIMSKENKQTKRWGLILIGGILLFLYKTCTGQLPPLPFQ